jgi:hypothetical protein
MIRRIGSYDQPAVAVADEPLHLAPLRTPCNRRILWSAALAAVGGLMLVMGLTLPTDGLGTQIATHRVPNEVVVKGERLILWGLMINGSALCALAIWFGSRGSRIGSPPLCPLWSSGSNCRSLTGSIWPVLGLMGLAVVLRLMNLDSGLWFDEVVTLTEFVRLPAAELVRNYADQNQHPLFSLMAHGSVELFGESAWALRLPAALFGVATVGVLYGFARLLAVSYHHVWFSQNARGYTMLVFFALLGSWLFLENLHRPRLSLSLGYGAVMALAM